MNFQNRNLDAALKLARDCWQNSGGQGADGREKTGRRQAWLDALDAQAQGIKAHRSAAPNALPY
jgi:hypothetical protein